MAEQGDAPERKKDGISPFIALFKGPITFLEKLRLTGSFVGFRGLVTDAVRAIGFRCGWSPS
ncbi:hypothetical protein, partial [Sphingobium olei]|uniref:hypothetical protein n=1 Tax=Sphingobium olei TaxID=420955 RepID=UPI003D1A4DE3